ncbi:MAG: hypothetical protein GIW99_11765 [Candidatus Eremiobacteraeota bacterium]|nr:hypothetical protein [Candidatus Eremiobacteraeota bacterium]MBC5828337.1 hypothetical protein [Candidatus Eremiobacteraeota bacterium]
MALVVFFVLRSLVTDGTMPAFRHDWAFPSTSVQIRSHFAQYIRPWSDSSLGSPNIYGFTYPLAFTVEALSLAFTPHFLLVTLLGGALFAGGLGTARIVALIAGQRTLFGSLAAAVAYVSGPFVLNELGAGHVAELISYGAVPWFLLSVASACRKPSWVTLSLAGVLGTAAAVQPQYGLFCAAFLIIWTIAGTERRWVPGSILLILALGESQSLLTYCVAHGADWLSVDRVTQRWERIQSAQLSQAFIGSGYAAGYAERAYGNFVAVIQRLQIILAACSIVALAVAAFRRCTASAVVLVAGVLAIFLSAGSNGPLGGALLYAFAHIPAFAVLRELYHFAAVSTLMISVGIGVAVAQLFIARTRWGVWLSSAMCAAVAIVGLSPASGAAVQNVPRLSPAHAAAWKKAVDALAAAPGGGRVLFVPTDQPLGPQAAPYAGVDPDAFTIGSHAALTSYQPTPTVEYLTHAFSTNQPDAARTLAAYGIQFVVSRPSWRSKRFQLLEPSEKAIEALCDRASVTSPKFGVFYANSEITVYRNSSYRSNVWLAKDMPLQMARSAEPSGLSDDPRLGWVDGSRWAGCFSGLASISYPSLFTIGRRSLKVGALPRGGYLWIWAPDGAVIGDSHGRRRIKSNGFAAMEVSAPRGVTITAQGRAAVAGMSSGRNVADWMIPCSRMLVASAGCSTGIVAQNASSLWTAGGASEALSKPAAFPAAWHLKGESRFELRRSSLFKVLAVAGLVQLVPFFSLLTGLFYACLTTGTGTPASLREAPG